MTPEGESYCRYLAIVRDAILAELEAVPEEALNWPLGMPETNTLYASALHACMSSRDWIVVRVGGGSIPRDRASEFTAQGRLAELRDRWTETLAQTRHTLDRMVAVDYEAPRVLRFQATGTEREGNVRDCLLHVIEHTNIHLGQIQLGRQLWEHRHHANPSQSGSG